MSNVFNAAEVVDMGIEKEKKRRDFYALVAEKFKDANMRDLFTKLKDWETTHIKKFGEIRDTIVDIEITETYDGEFTSYMRALVDDKQYNQISPDNFAKNVKTPLSAMQYGIGFEKDSILFFNELLRFMPKANSDKVRLLVQEERTHIIYLAQLRNKMEDKKI